MPSTAASARGAQLPDARTLRQISVSEQRHRALRTTAVATAKRRAGSRYSPGKINAELTFDTCRFLLARRYKTTLWPIVFRGLPNLATEGRGQEDFEGQVAVIYGLRNRCAHHEPSVKHDLLTEATRLDTFDAAMSQVARWIDNEAALWIHKHSRIPALRSSRPNYLT